MKKLFRKLFPSKERRAFNKMHRRHRKELIKHAKKTDEWDWGYLHDSIIMQIKHMHEYYAAGNNVWQTDKSRMVTVEQLQHILDLNAQIDRLWDDCCQLDITHIDGRAEIIFPDDFREKANQLYKREQELYEELYHYIGKYLRWWWD